MMGWERIDDGPWWVLMLSDGSFLVVQRMWRGGRHGVVWSWRGPEGVVNRSTVVHRSGYTATVQEAKKAAEDAYHYATATL